jgi:hypothetical protein
MLSGRITAQDEEEVESELEALAKAMAPKEPAMEIPAVPDTELPQPQKEPVAAAEELRQAIPA